MAKLDISESACPRTAASRQDEAPGVRGRRWETTGVSVLPTLFGEKIVLRLLDKDNLFRHDRLGFEPSRS